MTKVPIRPPLKWAGGKFLLLPKITPHLGTGKMLVEPFVGAGSVFLNSNFSSYLLNDINEDLINFYRCVQQCGLNFIDYAKQFFDPKNNNAQCYYALRQKFNELTLIKKNRLKKAALFLYLNRHGYNGLCRYSKKSGFNVPFGRYLRPYFPEKELIYFHQKTQRAEFKCVHFKEIFKTIEKHWVIYCDPPYVPYHASATFTHYAHSGFNLTQQELLASLAAKTAAKIIISNHDTAYTRQIYREATLVSLDVRRHISCKSTDRNIVSELLAIYN